MTPAGCPAGDCARAVHAELTVKCLEVCVPCDLTVQVGGPGDGWVPPSDVGGDPMEQTGHWAVHFERHLQQRNRRC